MDMDERTLKIKINGNNPGNWYLDLTTADNIKLPFTSVNNNSINCKFEGMNYAVKAVQGKFSKPADGAVFRVSPAGNSIVLNLAGSN